MNASVSDLGFWWVAFVPIVIIGGLLGGIAFMVLGRRNGGQALSRAPLSIPHVYGYSVCLLSILVGLAAVTAIPDSVMEIVAPIRSDEGQLQVGGTAVGTLSLTSYEAFRATAMSVAQTPRDAWGDDQQSVDGQTTSLRLWTPGRAPDSGETVAPADPHPNDQERARYEQIRSDRSAAVRLSSTSALISELLGLALCVTLFRAHARWLTSMGNAVSPTA